MDKPGLEKVKISIPTQPEWEPQLAYLESTFRPTWHSLPAGTPVPTYITLVCVSTQLNTVKVGTEFELLSIFSVLPERLIATLVEMSEESHGRFDLTLTLDYEIKP